MDRSTKRAALVIAVAVFAGLTAHSIADSYIDRLPDHRGLYLVAADNTVSQPPLNSPARTVVIVVDGLREDAARTMRSVDMLAEAGQCRSTDVGSLTISRPVYTVISSGLEADRTGSRNNDDTSPVAVESVWEVARTAGLEVSATSELLWWQQLFPRGFDRYLVVEPSENAFERAEMSDVTLIHPVYVDEAGHDHGGTSRQYREAIARVDADIAAFLADHVALRDDLVVLTADHGHTERGGHGGPDRVASHVLTCWAGAGVTHSPGGAMDVRTIAPTLAVLLGVPFPRNMRAGQDDLDTMWDIVDARVVGEDYVAARRTDVDRMREINRNAIAEWLDVRPSEATWTALYDARGRRDSVLFGGLVAFVLAVLAASLHLRRLGWRKAICVAAWMAGLVVICVGSYVALRGGFDFTSINRRALFVRVSLACCGVGTVIGAAAHLALWRDLDGLMTDLTTLAVAIVAVDLAHPVAYGWRMGFPLPGPKILFIPFFAASLTAALGALAMIAAAVTWYRGRRAREDSREN